MRFLPNGSPNTLVFGDVMMLGVSAQQTIFYRYHPHHFGNEIGNLWSEWVSMV